MTIIPTLRCHSVQASVAFYTTVLDFTHKSTFPRQGDPAFCVLERAGDELHLSSHSGDGAFGQAVTILVADAGALFAEFTKRGLDPSGKPDSPVHQGPVDQTWGTREFYADDPDGNTLRYVQRPAPSHR